MIIFLHRYERKSIDQLKNASRQELNGDYNTVTQFDCMQLANANPEQLEMSRFAQPRAQQSQQTFSRLCIKTLRSVFVPAPF